MSRQKSQTDSLDLLLDTICNTFGGVLFIAILVVILLQLSGESPTSDVQQAVSPDVFVRLQSQHASVMSKLAQLREAAASRDAVVSEFTSEQLRQLIHTQQDITDERDQLQETLNELMAENIVAAEEVARARASNAQLLKSLIEARDRRKTLERELTDLRESRVQQLALPIAKEAFGKGEVSVIVRYGRLYIWHRYDHLGLRRGLNTDEFVVIGEDEESGALITQPKPTAGIPLDDSEMTRQAIRARLAPFSPSREYITVVVRSDSFGQFQHLRDMLIELGFEYRLMPATVGTAIVDRGGSGGKVQ